MHQPTKSPKRSAEKRGTLIQSLLPLEGEEKISAVVALTEEQAQQGTGYFVLATSRGRVKRVAQNDFMGCTLQRLDCDERA